MRFKFFYFLFNFLTKINKLYMNLKFSMDTTTLIKLKFKNNTLIFIDCEEKF